MARRTSRKRKPLRTMRWLVLGVALLIGFLYYRPVSTYFERKREFDQRAADVRSLEHERRALERRLANSQSPESVERQARRLGLVRRGERLFIVSGIPEWRRAQRRR